MPPQPEVELLLLKLAEEERRVIASLEGLWHLRDSDGVFIDSVDRVVNAVEDIERLEDKLHRALKELQAKREEFNGT